MKPMKPTFTQHDAFRFDCLAEGPMRAPGRIYATEPMMADILKDNAASQVANVACLPGIVGRAMAMPDAHWGYGFPIGGVAAFDPDEGVISPGGVGYDINCGVRLLRTPLTRADLGDDLSGVARTLSDAIPAGMGSQSHRKLSGAELDRVLKDGARWAVEAGFGTEVDLEHTEEQGTMRGADVGAISKRARERGLPQLGSLGSGNHFCELGVVEAVYDPETAEAFGLFEGQITVMIHSGSRGLGYQICDDAIRLMLEASARYGIELPDRQLCAAPLSSPEAAEYFAAMACAINYAFANRQMMSHFVREGLSKHFGGLSLGLVYDVCHNIAKWEEHEVDGVTRRLCVHRKGATRAFAPGRPEVPARYRAVGQPVLIPGDMGRYSFVLAGAAGAMKETFGSCCHGAGRVMSRTQAVKAAEGRSVFKEMKRRGVLVRCEDQRALAEEAPEAYKDVADVVDVVHGAGLAKKVAKLKPLVVVKG